MSWTRVLNQSRAKEILQTVLEKGRMAHAYLFSGPPGAGMDAMALEFAKTVNCERSSTEACDQCSSCQKANRHQHPDIHLVFALPVGMGEKSGDSPMAKLAEEEVAAVREQIEMKWNNPYHKISLNRATAIKINSVREIRRETSLMASEKGRKVFILFDAELMNDEASNALLKTLEEPPPQTLLILTTTQPSQLLPTLSSRCQHLPFQPLTTEDVRLGLLQRENVSEQEADSVAVLSKGNYARALQLLQTDYRKQRDEFLDFLRLAVKGKIAELLQHIDRVTVENDKDEIIEGLQFLQGWLRDAMITQQTAGKQNRAADESLHKFVTRYTNVDYRSADDEIERAISLIGKNVYISIILLTLAFSLEKTITGLPGGHHRKHE
jgi:DNA polymerase III subunit delta'